jgi:uncharacterized protein HemX
MNSIILTLILTALVSGGGYVYFKYTQKKIENLTSENIVLKGQNIALTREKENTEKALQNLGQRLQQSEEYQEEFIRILQRHDLTKLAMSKPGLIEKRINDATQNLLEEFESDSNQ